MDQQIPFTPLEDIEKQLKEEEPKEEPKKEGFFQNIMTYCNLIISYIVYILAAVGVLFLGKSGWDYYIKKKIRMNIHSRSNILIDDSD